MRINRFDIASWPVFAKVMGPPGPHPPYTLHQEKGLWYVQNALGMKKNKKGYKTQAEAEALQRALYAALPPK